MAARTTVYIKGLDELRSRLKKYPKIAGKHFKNAMLRSTILIERNVKPLTPVGVSGHLRKSIHHQVRGVGVNITGIVGSSMKKEIYPLVMEEGREPGAKMPPPKALERWVWIVLKVPREQVKGTAFVVARAIGKRGIKGKFFLKKGFEKSQRRVEQYFAKALDYIVEEIAGK